MDTHPIIPYEGFGGWAELLWCIVSSRIRGRYFASIMFGVVSPCCHKYGMNDFWNVRCYVLKAWFVSQHGHLATTTNKSGQRFSYKFAAWSNCFSSWTRTVKLDVSGRQKQQRRGTYPKRVMETSQYALRMVWWVGWTAVVYRCVVNRRQIFRQHLCLV